MTCEEAAALAGAYLDSEEDAASPIASHVATCPNCARLMERRRNWQRVVQTAPRFHASDAFANRLRAAVASAPVGGASVPAAPETTAGESRDEAESGRVVELRSRRVEVPGPAMVRRSIAVAGWLTAVAAVLVCGSLSLWLWASMRQQTGAGEADLVARDAIGSHIRSLMGQHLTDVPSSDHHTVKPWFAGKVPFSIPVPEFPTEGYTLEGGRLDYVAGRSVAALVYRRRQHAINVFIWPLGPNDRVEDGMHANAGYEAISWSARGLQFWAVSDLNDIELRQFIGLFQRDQ